MKNNFFEPLVLEDIPYNFAVIFPVNGRDTLCIYNDRKFALKAYGYLQSSGRAEEDYSFLRTIFNAMSIKSNDKEINFIFSENTFSDLKGVDDRSSNLIFSWEGYSDRLNHRKMSKLFYSAEVFIYENFRDWLRVKSQDDDFNVRYNLKDKCIDYSIIENIERNIERNIEERVSVIVYQGEKSSSSIMRKNKKMKQLLMVFSLIYAAMLTSLLAIKYFL
ncbi:Uncharacterised protein [Serratia fonticola]|uniref:hypothetical protein n=1 Tax=Serratia fonticola TaxID=47917 RepID=UPI002178F028|nr:hypothetical protein [Serratia fonticola]CAI1920260.1 Uncharacterised protein [Serratia fonticola]